MRRAPAGYRMNMPFENVHGNGGLLTTVGDLLKWNENFVSPKVGDAAFLKIQQEPGRFNDGKAHEYALGLYVRPYKGVPEVSHSGATAGYRAHLTRFPQQHLSVAVLCNVSTGSATQYAQTIAEMYLGDAIKAMTTTAPPRPRASGSSLHSRSEGPGRLPWALLQRRGRGAVRNRARWADVVLKRRPDTTSG